MSLLLHFIRLIVLFFTFMHFDERSSFNDWILSSHFHHFFSHSAPLVKFLLLLLETAKMDLLFTICAFFLLSIERILYGYWFCYPKHFEKSVRNGNYGTNLKNEPLLWKCAMTLGMYVKVFQFSVIIYDLLVRCDLAFPLEVQSYHTLAGVVLLVIGQGLNYAVFQALKPIGVYYGHEFGYDVPMVSGFPYNIGISDPQYWGVVLCIWGIYLTVGATSYIVPILETFWYLMSMRLLENQRGRNLLRSIFGEDVSANNQSNYGSLE